MTQGSEAPPVLRHVDEACVVLQLNRPGSRHAINWEVVDLLDEELDLLEAGTTPARVLVVAGSAGAFCSGADLRMRATMVPAERHRHARAIGTLFTRISRLSMPTIAVVDGPAMGAGCELALACDLRIASDAAVFGLPETSLGVFPGAGGTQRLARLVGAARAKEIILLGRPMSAARALAVGLASVVVPRDELPAEVSAWTGTLARRAPLAVAAAKRAIDEGLDRPLDEALAADSELLAPLFASHDHAEGIAAFAERREPRFAGA